MNRHIAFVALAALFANSLCSAETLTPGPGFGKISYFTCPSVGEMRFPVIFAAFDDANFSGSESNLKQHFNDKFNLEGFDWRGAEGSVRDYFWAASNGRFDAHFDFYGPVKVSKARKHYGANIGGRTDAYCADLVIEACEQLIGDIDWSIYDSNGDGFVDDVIVVYAGESEYSRSKPDYVLPKSFIVSFDKYNDANYYRGIETPDGLRIDSYTLINELDCGQYDGIGTFVHEFMHCLGLADVYNVYDTDAAYTPQTYDVMDVGIYNNSSLTPPTPSAFERFALGWLDLEIIDGSGPLRIQPLLKSNRAYAIPVSENEVYILENRQQQGWDAYIPGHGLLIWHIDYNPTVWYNNQANYYHDYQRIDLVEACGTYYANANYHNRYPFPGANGVTACPTLYTWDGTPVSFAINSISETPNGDVMLSVVATDGIESINEDTAYTINGREVTIGEGCSIYDLFGRCLLKGPATTTLSNRLLIVHTPISTTKHLIH